MGPKMCLHYPAPLEEMSQGESITATQLSVTQVRTTSWSFAKHVIAGLRPSALTAVMAKLGKTRQ